MGPVSAWTWVAALLLALPLAVPHAAAQQEPPVGPPPPRNGMDNAFGTLSMPFLTEFAGEPAPVEVRIALKPGGGLDRAGHVLFAFDAPGPAVRVQLLSLERASGTPLILETDERTGPGSDPRQPKVVVRPGDVPVGEDLVMRGLLTARSNGRFMVGALVIAFDADWGRVTADGGQLAELYGYTTVKSQGLPAPGLVPPFEGRGTGLLPGLGLGLLAVTCVSVALRLWRRVPG